MTCLLLEDFSRLVIKYDNILLLKVKVAKL